MPDYNPLEVGLRAALVTHAPAHINKAPEDATYPLIVFKRVSTTRQTDLNGNAGIASSRIQITCWATTPLAAKRLSETVRLALQTVKNTTWGDHLVFGIKHDNQLDTSDETVIINGEHGAYGEIQDIFVTYQEVGA